MRFGGLIAAVVFAAIAAVVVLRMSGNSAPAPSTAAPAPEAKSVNIYVATKPITIGTTIAETDIGVQPWPEHLMLDGFVPADGKTNLVGMVTRAPMLQNEPVTAGKFANPNDPNFLAGELPKGMRVITILVNEADGVAGFVFPGDHVDLIYTHDVDKVTYVPNSGGEGTHIEKTREPVSETLLTNVKVLAIDQRSSAAGATDAKGNLVIPRSASLMVSAADSQRVRLAQRSGAVSLVLRALADKESADPLTLTGASDISQSKTEAGNPTQSDRVDEEVRILRGAPNTPKESEKVGTAVISRGAATSSGTQGIAVPNPTNIVIPNPTGNVTTSGPAASR